MSLSDWAKVVVFLTLFALVGVVMVPVGIIGGLITCIIKKR